MPSITRRGLLVGASALPPVTVRTRPARAAEFTCKLGTNLPAAHPLSARNIEAAARIREATGGQMEINVFPSSQLGTDTDMLIPADKRLDPWQARMRAAARAA